MGSRHGSAWQHRHVEGLKLEFAELNFDQVNGPKDIEVAIGVEADLVIADGATVVLSEPRFEVLLLAKELNTWLAKGERADFTADLGVVLEDVGAVRITDTADGWVVSSDLTGIRGTPRSLRTVQAAVRRFISNVGQQVAAAGYDPRLTTVKHDVAWARRAQRELGALLNEWDPIGVFDAEDEVRDPGAAAEYDCICDALISHLLQGEGRHEIASLLGDELTDHFGLGAWTETSDVVDRIFEWWELANQQQ